jgi:hypothetical protein
VEEDAMSLSRRLSQRAVVVLAVALGIGWAASVAAQSKAKAKPAAAPAAAAAPTVGVAGLRIVAPGLGEQGTEVRAFNESAGLALALVIKMSGGAGIVEIDREKCTLTALSDDTEANLLEEARFGHFPKVTKDGTAGLIEVESRVRPSPGATSVSAEGTIAVKSSSGTKVQKVPNLPLQAGKFFKIGTATVTVGEVTVDGESASLSLKLPRSALALLKDIRWKDAKGQPVEVSRMGSGWMNDDAEISYRIPAALKTASLELDVWQNLKEQAVPFSLKLGISLK